MKKKRIFSGILSICLLVSTMCIPTFGVEEDSKGLEQAIVATKKVITVPDSYTDFTHYSSERETSEGKIMVWSFNWSEKEGKNGFISASIGENGFLYDYNKHTGDENHSGLAQVTKDTAQISAEEFLKKVIPTSEGVMKRVDGNSNISSNEEYNFTYQKFVNEIPVNFIIVNIGVNKYSGEITSFNGENPGIKRLEYPTLDNVIEAPASEKAYIDKLGVNLKYYSYYDYKEKKMKIFAGYSVDDNKYKAIDGKTGQVITILNEDKIYNKNLANSKGDESITASSKTELSKEEQEAVNNVAGLISKEKAESIIKESTDILTAEMKVIDASLNKNESSEKYVWQIGFEGGYGKVNAQSGELISVHFYDNKVKGNKNISKLEAKDVAENFLKKVTPNKFVQTKYEEQNEPVLKISGQEEESSSYFNFVRQVNGIEFVNNSLRIEVDKTNGKVIGYDNNWYDNATFPDISQAMTKEAAFNKIKQLKSFGLQYVMLDKDHVGLVYNFKNLDRNYIIDPISGIRLDFMGQVYKENKLPEYTDISGHWCEKTVKELLENGYYIDGDKFNPNMNITQINFLKYIYSPMKNNYTDDEFYDMLFKEGIIKKEEKSSSSFVSNQDAAKFIIRYLGHDKIATHPEIFSNPFKDNVQEQYKGYAAMCYALNIIRGDRNGNFNGTHNLNNAEAALIVYNLVKDNKR
ncbi:peptidase M4 [Clostridium gelidum]|uniref:Peptidase M4 n=1 Tax=Clostridium gelidum TaxID=704125 RepID=A0ABN6IRX3_9CLOT|nr:YcdB/YcdC domain-containing protein [Clostridium gelidum]BCZ44704.1 peptidase M4 [Clostridium gelidum]